MIEFIILENKITQSLTAYCNQVWNALASERCIIKNDRLQRVNICEMVIEWFCATAYWDYSHYRSKLLPDENAFEQFYDSTNMIFESYVDLSKDTVMNKSLYIRGIKVFLQQHTTHYLTNPAIELGCHTLINTEPFDTINQAIYDAVNGQCRALWDTGSMNWRGKVNNHILTCENILKWYCLVEGYNYYDHLNDYAQLNKDFQNFRNGTRIVFDDMVDLGCYKENCQHIYVLGIVDWLKAFTHDYFYTHDFKKIRIREKDEV